MSSTASLFFSSAGSRSSSTGSTLLASSTGDYVASSTAISNLASSTGNALSTAGSSGLVNQTSTGIGFPTENSGLPSGTIARIVIGSVGGLATCLAVFGLCRRRKKPEKEKTATSDVALVTIGSPTTASPSAIQPQPLAVVPNESKIDTTDESPSVTIRFPSH